jgi:hypothetical protein
VSDYTHTNLTLVGKHEPDYSNDRDAEGNFAKSELPGFYTVGVEIEGVFVPLIRIKAGKLLQDIERAKQSQGSSDTPPES